MADFPALPFWTDAYLADTSHLSYEEHGIYFHILMTMWRTPGCQMPCDENWINKRFKGNANAVRTLCEEFCLVTDDGKFWFQKRLRKQWKWCCEKREKATENANTRWNKDKTPSERNATAMQTQSNGNASKSKSISKSSLEGVNGFLKEGRGFVSPPDSPEFTAWKQWTFEKETAWWRELVKREQEGRAFDFPSRWPPGHKEVAA